MSFFQSTSKDPDTHARTGLLRFDTGRGDAVEVETPVFMPVGTVGSVKGLWQEHLEEIGYGLILGNTYHLKLRPGPELIESFGGLAKFIGWSGAILTDSGGFQAFSLAERVKFLEEGIEFASHIDGSRHLFTPGSVIDIQNSLGSDIMMVIDDCPPGDADQERVRLALERTHAWARRSIEHHRRRADEGKLDADRRRLFGIIQGGIHLEHRRESAQAVQDLPFDGIAVGGLSVGETRESMYGVLEDLGGRLDEKRPRYLMGVGTIPDFLEAVRNGIDMFDCVLPTRNARNGQIFTSRGKINLRNAQYADKNEAPDPECRCRVCRRYSLGYMRHLFISKEMLGPQLATYHNLHFIFTFMAEMRSAIRAGRYLEFYERWKKIPF